MHRPLENPSPAAGWSLLAKEALELGALALAAWAMEDQTAPPPALGPVGVLDPEPAYEPQAVHGAPEPALEPPADPVEFVKEIAVPNTRIYRARDGEGTMYAAFYPDGRVRMGDDAFRFAGMVQNGHAHLLQIGAEDWSEVFVRVTPGGLLQLELRDGPYDGRVLTCEMFSV